MTLDTPEKVADVLRDVLRDVLGIDAKRVAAFDHDTPLMWRDKEATWRLAHALGGDTLVDLILEETHSCYLGDRTTRHDWGYGCGSCPACELRARGWRAYRS